MQKQDRVAAVAFLVLALTAVANNAHASGFEWHWVTPQGWGDIIASILSVLG